MVTKRLEALREEMKKRQIAYYLIFTSDFHQSEYVAEYFQARKYFSGFTGSAGTLLVGQHMAGLWTDGRYFIQAERQLEGSGIQLFRMGEEGVPSVFEYLEKELRQGENLAFDARTIAAKEGTQYQELLNKKQGKILLDTEIVDRIWKDRPGLSKEPAFLLEEKYSGRETSKKLENVRECMKKNNTQAHVLATLDDIAWLYNIRGNDIAYNPVVLAYSVITMEQAVLFVDESKFNEEQKNALSKQGVSFRPYADVFSYVAQLDAQRILLDEENVSFALMNAIHESAEIVDQTNPELYMKAIKNPTEIENLKNAHIKDGVAVTRFMAWIKNAVKEQWEQNPINEWSAAQYLEELRRQQDGFIELSFTTIAGYNENAAMMHYSATEDNYAVLKPEGILLVDSGGQYYEGTTDVTRTFGLGPVDEEVKTHFTLVLQGMLRLQNARFLYGCTGQNLDILARGPMWDVDLDYKCGTGHGVGYLLGVHEAPNGFRWKKRPERNDGGVLEAGMVTTDEPGIYIEGSHGIRTENELLCVEGSKNEYGQYMYFEPITMVPIDLDLIKPEMLSQKEKQWLNDYHALVFEKLSPYMEAEEKQWLAQATREI